MKKIIIGLVWLGLVSNFDLTSQVRENENNPWIVGIGVNTIDDSGARLGKFLSFDENYHFANPFMVFVEKRFHENFGAAVMFANNTFKEGKIYNENVLTESIDFFAVDGSLKYYWTNLFMDRYRSYFEGFIFSGLGNSWYNSSGNLTFNAGAGFVFFVSNRIRLTTSALGKISIKNSGRGTNYFQYNLGLLYRFYLN